MYTIPHSSANRRCLVGLQPSHVILLVIMLCNLGNRDWLITNSSHTQQPTIYTDVETKDFSEYLYGPTEGRSRNFSKGNQELGCRVLIRVAVDGHGQLAWYAQLSCSAYYSAQQQVVKPSSCNNQVLPHDHYTL